MTVEITEEELAKMVLKHEKAIIAICEAFDALKDLILIQNKEIEELKGCLCQK